MQKPPDDSVTGSVPLAVRWHRLQSAYRICNVASHHVLGLTLKLLALVYFTGAIVLLVLRYAVLPNIDHYKGHIERLASGAVGNPVTIARIYASWSGLRPSLFLGDVALRDADGRDVLLLPSVSATLSWWSVASASVRFESLELIRPALDVRRDSAGRLYVAGMPIDTQQHGDGRGADWLLSQREIVIREGQLTWTDEQRGAPALALGDVNVVMRNKWRRHQLGVHATPPAALGAPLDVRADFTHPAFATRPSNLAMWKGELYADLRRADLAAWKQYIDYPLDVASGMGSVRAWLTLDRARLSAFTADVGLADVEAVLGKGLPPLDLLAVQGRISASEDFAPASRTGRPPFGVNGHQLAVTDFSLRTRDGLSTAPTTLSERYVPAAGGKPERMEVRARLLDLATLAALATRLPLSAPQRQMLADFAPRGVLRDFSAEWQGAYPALQSYRVQGALDGLSVAPQAARAAQPRTATQPAQRGMPALPGFDNLSGSIDATERGGTLALDSDGLVLRMPAYFDEAAMPFDKFAARASWSFDHPDYLVLTLDSLDLVQQGISASVFGKHILPLNGKGPGTADFSGKLNGFDVTRIGRYLPTATPEHLRHWLTGALEKGAANDVSLRLRGDLAHFPFKNGDRGAEKTRGEFRIAGRIDNGTLNYDPGYYAKDGKSPLWPQAEQIKGSFAFEGTRMEIRADTARTGNNVALSNVKAVIADLSIHDQVLEIDGAAAAPMQDFLKYVAASPVLEWIGHFTDETTATANAKLALKLQLPLSHLIESKVQGALQLQGNDVVLWNDMPPVQGATGKIEFNEKGVNLNALAGTFLGGPTSVTGGTQRDGTIQIKLAGAVTTDGLRKNWPAAEVQRLASHFDGGARYTGLITARDHHYTVAIDSTLAGLGLDLPAPLAKSAADAMALRFVLNGASANEAGLARDDIKITLGPMVAASYQRQRQGKGPWKLVRGGIGVGVAAPEPDSGMMINANVGALNVDHWLDLGLSVAGPASASSGTAAPASEGGMAQYVLPDALAARAGELVIGERKLERVVVGVTHEKGVWQANIDSSQVDGYLTWNESPTGQGVGKLTARLSSLIIPESAANDVKDLLENKATSPTIPALDIVAERFELFNKQLGRLELQAHNALITSSREWRVSKLALSNADGELRGTGRWLNSNGQHNTNLNFVLDIADAGKLLDRFGFRDTLRNGKGKLSGDIAWRGLPYALDIPTLSGQIKLDVAKGQFLKQDPGAAKLLGVLSLQALPRLLKLDFHDVFSEGLAFDGISANAAIERGIAKTDNLKMHGVAATVLMDGSADIANESTDLRVVVIPEVNLGTAPLVYALAVNPVIGLGSFLAQLFLSAPVMKALTYQMQVTGPWKAPVITKLDMPNPGKPLVKTNQND